EMRNTHSPTWLQEFSFMLEQPPIDEYLRLEFIDHSMMGHFRRKGTLGHVDINLTDVINKKRTYESYQLNTYNPLRVELQWRTTD
ncbi:hypothetical protein M8C21_026571, partial [Ambrosia artemisiifolia]